MTDYEVSIAPAAQRQLRKLDAKIGARIVSALRALAREPRPAGGRAMVGRADSWRIRVGDCRVVYEIHDGQLLVLVITIAHRRDVYRR